MTVRRAIPVLTLAVLVLFAAPLAHAQVNLTTLGTPYTQNFDTLIASGSTTWTNNSNIPGWFHQRTGTGTTIVANNGSSNAGNLYSYGTGTATDRALGSVGSGNAAVGNLFWGVRLQNNTGATITQLDVTYTGEQWRNSAAAAQTIDFSYLVGSPTVTGTLAEFQSAGVAVPSLNFTSPITGGTAGALDGNLAANRVTLTFSITGLSIPNGTEVMLRWSDPDHTGADHGLSIDDFAVTPQGAAPNPPVVPTCPATVSTTSGTATTAGVSATDSNGTVTSATITSITPSDPGTITLTGFTPAGGVGGTANATLDVSNTTPVGSYNVTIQWSNNDGVPQTANCVVAVNVTAPIVIVPIHDIQGNGTTSPLAGQTVTARGIVTLLKSNGFFLQEELADYDADVNTSEGIFVFTSSAPTVAVGDDATVTGTAVEFNGLTEISPVTNVTTNSTGNTLPTAVTLTALDLPTSAGPDQPQLEKYEGMRLLAPSLVTVAPNDSFFDVETVLTPQPRPFREPGIPASDPIPPDPTSGLPDPNIPIWDENPERLNVDTNGRAGSTGETLTSNVTLTNVAGPLDFAFGRYRLINEATLTRTADMSAVPVPMPAADEFTVAGYNIENFNNNATQRQKAALTIRDVLRLPDIIGTVEIFDLADLQALANEIQTIAGVTYSAHLIEQDGTSEDSDQDVGFLVKTSRVSVTSVTAERATDTYINPNTGLPETLHDRPPLVLRGTVDPSGPTPLPVIVVVNHLRSFIDIELVAGEGVRVRAKRRAQAESLADLLHDLQTDNPTTPVISLGDYNAFQFNSGYDDSISVLKGMPTPDDQIVVDQSPDLVNPNYDNLIDVVPADQRYTFIFEGTPQALDHMLVNTVALGLNTGIAVARVNADFPEVSASVYASNAARPERNSDHDPVVGFFQLLPSADVSMTKTLDTAGPYIEGQSVTYTLLVANAGPDAATNIQVTDTPTNLTITSVSGSGCSSLPCTIASLAAGANTSITVTATIAAAGAFDNSADATAAEADPNTANNTDNTGNGGTATAQADVSLTKSLDTAGPYYPGQSITYTIVVANAGPSTATNINVTDTPTNLTITGVSGSGCGSFPCTIASLASGANTSITVTATIDSAGAFDNSANATAAEPDPNTADNTDNTGNGGTAAPIADVTMNVTLNISSPYFAGETVTFILDAGNSGPSTATNVQVTGTPTNLTITSVSGGGCSSLPCTIASIASSSNVQVFVNATIDAAGAFSMSGTANGAESDPNSANNTDSDGDTATLSADVSIVKTLVTSGPYNVGQTVTYTLDVANAGPSTATTVQVTDTPTNLTITGVSGGGCAALPCTIASIASGSTVQITVTATIDSVGVFNNSASANGAEPDPNLANNTDNVDNGGTTGNAADVSVVKSITTPGPYHQGDTVSFQIVVSNAGPNTANNVVVTDTPIGVNIVAGSISGGGCTAFPCTIPSLANGASVTITFSGTIQNPGSFDNSATVSATEFDPITSNNSDLFGNGGVAQNTVDVAITKTLNTAGPYVAGQSITYTLVVSNTGPGVALFVVVTDTPTNLTITSVSGAGCTSFPCTLVPGVTPTPASNRTITVVATINAPGAFDNSATATPRSSDFDPNLSNNTDNTGNGGVAGGGGADTDGDGVADAIEQAAPNGGDGNGDGIQDWTQGTVASIPAAVGSGYLTLQSSCQLQQVAVTTEGAMPTSDPGFNYPHGLIAFRAPCSSATFSLFIYGSGAANAYRKFGPLPPGGPQQWYGIPATFSTATVGSLNPRRADFSLTDGGTGDDTPVDGVIVDQGGPAEPTDVPTLDEWALMALAAMLAAIAMLAMKR